jgi:hypothetical protein
MEKQRYEETQIGREVERWRDRQIEKHVDIDMEVH